MEDLPLIQGHDSWHCDKERRKWAASISYNGKRMFIGRYSSKEDAVSARLAKESELFEKFIL